MAARTSTGRHRAPAAKLGRWLFPSAATLTLWLGDNDPGSLAGFAAFLALGLLLSLFWPLLALIALEAPGALVPARWRASWRYGQPRPHISDRLRRTVYAADRYTCCYCRSSVSLQLDHVRPWSLGGRTSFLNMVTLCGDHNRIKSNYWRDRDGYVHYKAWNGHGRPSEASAAFAFKLGDYKAWNGTSGSAEAAAILAFELSHRRSIRRFIRAAMAL